MIGCVRERLLQHFFDFAFGSPAVVGRRALAGSNLSSAVVQFAALNDSIWPVAGAPVGEIDATLLTFKIRSDRPVWGELFRERAVAGRPFAVTRGRQLSCR